MKKFFNLANDTTALIISFNPGLSLTLNSLTGGVSGTNCFRIGDVIHHLVNNSTFINYSVPETGEVIFHVHSISGQLLYSKTIEASRGNQSIELNTSAFSSGIYFYSIKYSGQQLVKRMSVK
jgi:hypothetical protein